METWIRNVWIIVARMLFKIVWKSNDSNQVLRRLCVRRPTQLIPLPFYGVSKNLYLGQEASNCMATTWAFVGSNSFTIAVFC